MADAGASPQPQSLSFTQGFLLGQLSIVILIGAFIKFFIFGDPPSADATAAARATARRQRTLAHRRSLLSISSSSSTAPQQRSLRRKRSNVLRNTPPSTISSILSKTYYNVNAHQPESLDWFNVLVAQTIAQFRSDAQHDDALLKSLNDVLNGPQRPDLLSEIKVTEIEMGEEFPIFSNCRIIPVDEHGFGISAAGQGSHGWGEGNRLQARMDVDLSDSITLGVETKLVLNYPKPMVAVLPVALAVSVVRFSGTLSISFIPSSPSTPSRTTLAFSFLDDYRLDLSVRSLVGSRSRLQDVPKIAQVVEALLHSWFDERCVEPRFQQIALPSFWPRKRNTRGGETEQEDGIMMSAGAQKNVERDLREEARREIEAEQLAAKERIAALEREGLRWRLLSRQTQADGEASYTMPGTLLHDE